MSNTIGLVMLDLFSGSGAASDPARERGWRVVAVDRDARLRPDVVADVAALPFRWFHVDVLWASPPCAEYSDARPGRLVEPALIDTGAWEAARAAVNFFKPTLWCIENVRGAQVAHGRAQLVAGACYLWGRFPYVHIGRSRGPEKTRHRAPSLRSRTPARIARRFTVACELYLLGLRQRRP